MNVVADGKLIAKVRRQVKSNGDFLEETDHLNPDGSSSKHGKAAGPAAHGAVVIDDANERLTFFGRAGLIHSVAEADLKALPDYAKKMRPEDPGSLFRVLALPLNRVRSIGWLQNSAAMISKLR